MRNLPPVRMKKVRRPDKASLLLDEEGLHMNERAIMHLMRMLNCYENIQHLDWPQRGLEEFAFSRCAIEEILQLVWDHPWTLASEIIEDFVLKMEFYKKSSVTDDQKRIFSVSTEMALKVLQEIKSLEK